MEEIDLEVKKIYIFIYEFPSAVSWAFVGNNNGLYFSEISQCSAVSWAFIDGNYDIEVEDQCSIVETVLDFQKIINLCWSVKKKKKKKKKSEFFPVGLGHLQVTAMAYITQKPCQSCQKRNQRSIYDL